MRLVVEAEILLDRVSKVTGELKEKIVAKGIVEYLKFSLREVNAELINICNRYGVASAEDMEKRYECGELEEEGTWRDFFRLSHLEERREILERLLEETLVE